MPFASCSAAPGGALGGLGASAIGVLVAGTLAASSTTCAGDAELVTSLEKLVLRARDKAGAEAPRKGWGPTRGGRLREIAGPS